MTIIDCSEGKAILLSKALDSKPKLLYLIYSLAFVALTIFFGSSYSNFNDSVGAALLWVLFVLTCSILAYRFINKAFQGEKLLLTKTSLVISERGVLFSRASAYDINSISNFRHLSKPELAKHPLAGDSFDYLGFQTEQEVINELAGDKRIAFDYAGKTITFGEHLYSWDFDELKAAIYNLTEKDFG